jgi:proteasome assembly chaperone (PAC2) family protein
MNAYPDIAFDALPTLKHPLLIAGFDGWGNALNVATETVGHIARQFKAQSFANLNADPFYRFDDNRPMVDIRAGFLKSIDLAQGAFAWARPIDAPADLVLLDIHEPQLQWRRFVDSLLDLCHQLGIETVITLGGLFDRVLPTEMIISGLVSDEKIKAKLERKKVLPIDYQGPSAIHSLIQQQASLQGLACISLWCHCPFYMQATTHYGFVARLGKLLAYLGHFELSVIDMEQHWVRLAAQIQKLLDSNSEVQHVIGQIRKERERGSWRALRPSSPTHEKVIDLRDYLDGAGIGDEEPDD